MPRLPGGNGKIGKQAEGNEKTAEPESEPKAQIQTNGSETLWV